ncbi:MAG: hypothetical protein ACR2RB_00985 [Gammaproteobacteria bacterium]
MVSSSQWQVAMLVAADNSARFRGVLEFSVAIAVIIVVTGFTARNYDASQLHR